MFIANFPSVVGHKVRLTYNMQKEEDILLRTCILRCITSHFFPLPVVGIMHVIPNILTEQPAIFVFWDKMRCKLINRYLHFGGSSCPCI